MRQCDADLFVTEQPLRFVGLEIGTRMAVVRLRDGGLFVHSPVRLDAELRREVDSLGEVRFVVAPNRFHHLFAGEWAATYPKAALYGAPGLERKRSDLRFAGVLGDAPAPGWAADLDQCLVAGFPLVNEVVFFHGATRTLLACDLAFQASPELPASTRLLLRLGGVKRFGPTHLERLLVRDRAAARRSLERILAWDFERVVIAHGGVLERGGREALRAGYAWLF